MNLLHKTSHLVLQTLSFMLVWQQPRVTSKLRGERRHAFLRGALGARRSIAQRTQQKDKSRIRDPNERRWSRRPLIMFQTFPWCGGDYGGFLGWRSPRPAAIFDALQAASAAPSLVALQELFRDTFSHQEPRLINVNGQAGLGFLRAEQSEVKGPAGSVLCLHTKARLTS